MRFWGSVCRVTGVLGKIRNKLVAGEGMAGARHSWGPDYLKWGFSLEE